MLSFFKGGVTIKNKKWRKMEKMSYKLKKNFYYIKNLIKGGFYIMREVLECTNYYLLNKDGFTFKIDSKDPGKVEVPEKGFVTAVTPLVMDDAKIDINTVISYVLKNPKIEILGKEYDLHIGGWFDEEEDDFVVDLSIVLNNEEDAIEIGKLTNQKAIYSIEGVASIYL